MQIICSQDKCQDIEQKDKIFHMLIFNLNQSIFLPIGVNVILAAAIICDKVVFTFSQIQVSSSQLQFCECLLCMNSNSKTPVEDIMCFEVK